MVTKWDCSFQKTYLTKLSEAFKCLLKKKKKL